MKDRDSNTYAIRCAAIGAAVGVGIPFVLGVVLGFLVAWDLLTIESAVVNANFFIALGYVMIPAPYLIAGISAAFLADKGTKKIAGGSAVIGVLLASFMAGYFSTPFGTSARLIMGLITLPLAPIFAWMSAKEWVKKRGGDVESGVTPVSSAEDER